VFKGIHDLRNNPTAYARLHDKARCFWSEYGHVDFASKTPEGYVLAEEQGEMYFCNARCLCLWAVHFVTNPFIEAAQWSAANALQGESNPWYTNGTSCGP